MAIIRFKFNRGESLKYIAHLDILRVFERALKRSKLPVSYTQGFNPRQKLVFGLPISIGLTSETEYADIELDGEVSTEAFMETLNANLPHGIRIVAAIHYNDKDNIMNEIASAKYEISFEAEAPVSQSEWDSLIEEILKKEEIFVMKKTKKGLREVNIRPLIFSMSITNNDSKRCLLEAFLSAGAENNLRPDLLMEALSKQLPFPIKVLSMHRKALFVSYQNTWKNPIEVAHA